MAVICSFLIVVKDITSEPFAIHLRVAFDISSETKRNSNLNIINIKNELFLIFQAKKSDTILIKIYLFLFCCLFFIFYYFYLLFVFLLLFYLFINTLVFLRFEPGTSLLQTSGLSRTATKAY